MLKEDQVVQSLYDKQLIDQDFYNRYMSESAIKGFDTAKRIKLLSLEFEYNKSQDTFVCDERSIHLIIRESMEKWEEFEKICFLR